MSDQRVSKRSAGPDTKAVAPASISLPRGGGAVRGIGEKFSANPVTGTGSLAVPIPVSQARSGFVPQLSISYDSGSGNGPFGLGWQLSLPTITRKTDKGLPRYRDDEESDVFVLSGSEDLVPVLTDSGLPTTDTVRTIEGIAYRVRPYRPRIEGLFARIERWQGPTPADTHWRTISAENVTTLYGRTPESRIADPVDPARIFSWLICESFDDKGNAIVYSYKPEDSAGVDFAAAHEANRTVPGRGAQRYPKRIRYGNRTSTLIEPDVSRTDWMFEVVFDYGEHDAVAPVPDGGGAWLRRHDAFSTRRPGFEVRTYRLCQRILLFHHFPSAAGVGRDCLVRSMTFAYRESRDNAEDRRRGNPIASFLASIIQSGHRRAGSGYTTRSWPPIDLEYSLARIDPRVHELDPDSLQNLAAGVDGSATHWIDLDGEGVPGMLASEADGWYYKPNLGGGRFGPVERVPTQPSLGGLTAGGQLLDLAADGRLDLVTLSGPTPGFFERTDDRQWETFRSFPSLPAISWNDPNLRFVDLDGDGHADVLITDGDVFTIYGSLGEDGFGPARHLQQSADEERGPRLVFGDGTQSIYVADMSGDGLSALVRVRSGDISYWPSLGHGTFGPRVVMDNAPVLDAPDQFDHRRVRLVDIDGSGTTDLIYLGRSGVQLSFNQSGNAWSDVHQLEGFPAIDSASVVAAADLLGNGTACLVWSTALPGARDRQVRYVDLMGGTKPHLLIGLANNLGAETRITYAASTQFSLHDKRAGRPWITRMPFPVHVVTRVETRDLVGRNRFVSRYAYRHGYFDGVEREFRGFGLVEQTDTEEFAAFSAADTPAADGNTDSATHVPPVLTRTWFHTGAFFDGERVSRMYMPEYYREPGLTDADHEARLLPDTTLDGAWPADEMREACRALKGSILRQEIFSLDGSAAEPHPYSTSERTYHVRRLQPQGNGRHCVFHVVPAQTLDCHYERDPAHPRVAHTCALEIDEFGNALRSIAVGYGRRVADAALPLEAQAVQQRTLMSYVQTRVTNPVDRPDAWRTPLPAEVRTFEITGLSPRDGFRFDPAELTTNGFVPLDSAAEIGFEETPSHTRVERRPVEVERFLYRSDDLAATLPLGRLDARAIAFESYRLAFTPALLAGAYRRTLAGVAEDLLRDPAAMLGREGGYAKGQDLEADGRFPATDPDDYWWLPSGQHRYSAGVGDTPAQELDAASRHFFTPRVFLDPFGGFTTVTYDDDDLLPLDTTDPVGSRMTAGERNGAGAIVRSGLDYRVLQPSFVMDANRNRSAAAFDALGLLVGTAESGKPEETLGDSLDGFEADLSVDAVRALLDDPGARAAETLGRATRRLVYDLFAFARTHGNPRPEPAAVCELAREIHESDLAPGATSPVRVTLAYSDGFGHEIQKKAPAEAGPLVPGGPLLPRWTGSAWIVLNNKGKPVREYEPFFSATHRFEGGRRVGPSAILFYDPAERVVAKAHSNFTYEKLELGAWQERSWDVNDTVLRSDPARDPHVGGFFQRLTPSDYLPTWHARRAGGALGTDEQSAALAAALHDETPTIAYLDPLGRRFMSVAHNRSTTNGTTVETRHATRLELDIEGEPRAIVDARGRVVVRYHSDLCGRRMVQASMDAGARWMLHDVAGEVIYVWSSRGQTVRTVFDPARRPTEVHLEEPGRTTRLIGRTVYGEGSPQPERDNLRGRVHQAFDTAGVATTVYDFKGNPVRTTRQLAADYRAFPDWSGPVPLEPTFFTATTAFDALDRPMAHTMPDGTVVRARFNVAGLLEQLEARLRGAAAATPFVRGVEYDAKGQRLRIDYGNGTSTTSTYDADTSRLVSLFTGRGSAFPADCPSPPAPPCGVQNLHYTFDPVGNVCSIRDEAQPAVFFDNAVVTAHAAYRYDALYRLIGASGREHTGLNSPAETTWDDGERIARSHPHDGAALRRYSETYDYDDSGNLLRLAHETAAGSWARTFVYGEASLLDASVPGNRLSQVRVDALGPAACAYDAHGNLTAIPELPTITWDPFDRLHATSRQRVTSGTPETTYRVYDAAGLLVRTVTETHAAAGQTPVRKEERVRIGSFERHRGFAADGTTVSLERETAHVESGSLRVALVETRTAGNDGTPAQVIRYSYGNHLGSTTLELDDRGEVLAYEEYYPYGSTAYQGVRSQMRPPRFRYSAKERDEQSGFYYYGARYYAPWLCRWVSPDPDGPEAGVNPYLFVRGNPITFVDPNGRYQLPALDDLKRRAAKAAGTAVSTQPSEATARRAALDEAYATSYVMSGRFGAESTLRDVEDLKAKLTGDKKYTRRSVSSTLSGTFLRLYLDHDEMDQATADQAGQEIRASKTFAGLETDVQTVLRGKQATLRADTIEEQLKTRSGTYLENRRTTKGIEFRGELNPIIGGVSGGITVDKATVTSMTKTKKGLKIDYRLDVTITDTYNFGNSRKGEYDKYRKTLASLLVAGKYNEFNIAYHKEALGLPGRQTKLDKAAVFASYMYALEKKGWTDKSGVTWHTTIPMTGSVVIPMPKEPKPTRSMRKP
jgi:RHS repeat-associated protein